MEKTEVKSEKKLENRAIAHKVSNLIHQQADLISQTIEDYTQRQNEREVKKKYVRIPSSDVHHNQPFFFLYIKG